VLTIHRVRGAADTDPAMRALRLPPDARESGVGVSGKKPSSYYRSRPLYIGGKNSPETGSNWIAGEPNNNTQPPAWRASFEAEVPTQATLSATLLIRKFPTHSPHFRFDPDVDVDAVTLQAACVPLSVPTVPARNHEKFVRVVQSK